MNMRASLSCRATFSIHKLSAGDRSTGAGINYLYCSSGTDISTIPLAPASEFQKKGLLGKYILVCTCPNGHANFLSSLHIFI